MSGQPDLNSPFLTSQDKDASQSALEQQSSGKKKWHQILWVRIAAVVVVLALLLGLGLGLGLKASNNSGSSSNSLSNSVSGPNVVFPNGTIWTGRGVNLGAWFIMNAIFGGFQNTAEFDFFKVVQARWDEATAYNLMNIYIDNAMTDKDFVFIKELGFNFVRLPIHFRNFQWTNGTWIRKPDGEIDFSRLDKAISMITSRGLYVSIDFHNWFGQDVLYERISKAEPWLPADLAAQCENDRAMAIEFLTKLTLHIKGRPGLFGLDMINEPVPSYDDTLTKVLHKAIRAADPDRMLIHYFATERPDPIVNNWTNVVYSFHVYNYPATIDGFKDALANKTAERWNAPYYLSEIQFAEYTDFPKALVAMQNANPVIPIWALWTYKAVHYNNWALVNYDDSFKVDLQVDSLEKIISTWKRLPELDLRNSMSPWGKTFVGGV
ncbi:glycoside hydrolase superfamily [Obelidium mucronatum]|nr:glycoside hydrolase superfamily [Obelidium mucronatum]